MTLKVEARRNMFGERVKWVLVIGLLLAGAVIDYYYNVHSLLFRLLGWALLLLLTSGIFFTTTQGKAFIEFVRESQVELRKVFWPTRQETLQITFFVAMMVLVLALVLWGMDSILVWLLGWLTGQRG
ncbi:MAG: preprotein translocase subunit SecE [Gammaproteobacteria bacterium]|nr:preprotein translocase subunit SecE [Gammaproteobacteria bacterium]